MVGSISRGGIPGAGSAFSLFVLFFRGSERILRVTVVGESCLRRQRWRERGCGMEDHPMRIQLRKRSGGGMCLTALYGGEISAQQGRGTFRMWIAHGDRSEKGFCQWIERQEVGQPLVAFGGSQAEVDFLWKNTECK